MIIPFSWLAEFVDLGDLTPQEVADRLSLQSVEAFVETFGNDLEGVIFARVVKRENHPEREDLIVATLDTGKGHAKVVSADKSVSVGDLVVFAPPGSKVGNTEISSKKFGSVVSEGVMLSAQEMGLEEHSEGVLKLKDPIEPGTPVDKLIGIGEELIELDITPNRGDVLSVRGLARDISALFGLKKKEYKPPVFPETGDIEIRIEDSDCKRYRGVVIEGVSVGDSPLYIRKRLWQCGIRSINNVVDITNYILLQEGQPLHAFDLDKLDGGIVVRSAREGETIVTLDGEERAIDPDILVIADKSKPVAVAGVMGGLESGVTENTKNILLESAYFEPLRVRRSSKKLGIQTDSSYRFERNVDIERVDRSQDVAVDMILKTARGEVEAVKDVYPKRYEPKKIFLPMGKFIRYAGESYKNDRASEILSALEIPHEIKRCGIEVFVPAHRSFDIHRDVDIIEEIMRVEGYDSYHSETLKLPSLGRLWKEDLLEIKKYLRDRGLSEVVNISYEEEDLYDLLNLDRPEVEILNPLVPTQRFMRRSLIPSLIRTAKFNESHYNYDLAIFEIGKVFTDKGEEDRLGILVKGGISSYPAKVWDAYELLSVVQGIFDLVGVNVDLEPSQESYLHPHVQTKIVFEGKDVGVVGKLHPSVAQKLEFKEDPFVCELSLSFLNAKKGHAYKPVSKFPPVIRDLALVVDKRTSVSKLLNEIKSQLGEKVEEVMVFDVYAGEKVGEGKKSVGVRITFRSKSGSLSSEEVNALVEELVRRLKASVGAEIR